MDKKETSDREQEVVERLKALLGDVFSTGVSLFPREQALAICQAASAGANVLFAVRLSPFHAVCFLGQGDKSVKVFEIEGGFHKFQFAEVPQASGVN